MKKLSLAVLQALSTGIVMSVVATVAQAQQQLERIEITGSRIRQIDAETAQPVIKITQEEIQKSGLVTVGDIVNALASVGSPDFSKGAVLTSNREQGGQYVNLRNLSSNQLLVLVNGKRWSQTVAGFTDLSTVPSSLIERIEVLRDGASSIYGSDAIAGVLNIILKKELKGGEASAYFGQNEKGDGKTEAYSFTYGTSTDKSSLMFAFNYNKTDSVWAKDREITAYSYGPDHPTDGYGTGPWGRIRQVNSLGTNFTGFNRYLNHTGGPLGDGVGQNSRDPNNYHTFAGAPEDLFNSSSQMMFQSPTELKSIFAKGSLDLLPNVRFGTTAMFADRDSSAQIAGYPLNSLSQPNFPVFIDRNNYFNPFGNSVQGAGNGQDLYFARRGIEVPRVTANNNSTLHIDGGFDGDLAIAGTSWNWNAGVNYSKVTGTTKSTGNLNLPALRRALGPSFLNASGVVQCGTSAAPISLVQCVPYDILGGPSASTQQALDYVMSVGQGTYSSITKSYTADIAGELFKLPAGMVGLATGVEHRTISGEDRPGQFEQSGFSTDLAASTTLGEYTVKEAYVELNIPILKGQAMAELLSVNLSSRYSDYSNFGETTNSKVSFMWKPIKDLLVRGTSAEGFRAPTLDDTFGGGSQTFDTYLDPCDSRFGAAATNPAVAARCASAGVSATFRQLNQAGSPVPSSGGAQSTSPFQAGAGNSSLTPETAKTNTLGLVFSPSMVKGLSVGLDWYKIEIDNRIVGVSANYVLNQCYVQGVASFCNQFRRDPASGGINYLERGNANLGQLSTEGLDLSLNYRLRPTAWGTFGLRSEIAYVTSFKVKSTAASEWVESADSYPYYRVKANIALDWSMGAWSATLGNRYYSSTKDQCWDVDVECSNPNDNWDLGIGYNRKAALFFSDLSVGYRLPWKGQILVGANNVFNIKPRILYNAGSIGIGSSHSSSVDANLPIDRFFFVRYNQTF